MLLTYIVAFILGSIIGSFLNVCIYRLPKSESIVKPSSYCPHCKKSIRFYDNIPIISYLFLLGKCRSCGTGIPIRYLIVETLSGLISLGLIKYFGLSLQYFIYLVLCSALIVIIFIDITHMIIPDVISIPGIILGIVSSTFMPQRTVLDSIIGAVVGGGILYIVASGYYVLTKREGMGGGDIKLLAMIGAFLGWKGSLFCLFAGSFFGSIVGLLFAGFQDKGFKYSVPFGPFLSIGAIFYIFYGETLMMIYF